MGYVGIMFQGKEKKSSRAQPKFDVDTPRRTRRSTRKDAEKIVSRKPLLELTAVSTFPSFNLWLPDNLARERDDEYVQTLKEWVPDDHLLCLLGDPIRLPRRKG
ncbi:hypothetical protein BDZ89DRAFT_1066910, partial [Hymenopellis radicata]